MEPHPTLFDIEKHINNSKEPVKHYSKVRLKHAERNQIEFSIASLDDLLPAEHKVRFVVDYVEQLDMSNILGTIQSVEGGVGRPATDVKILLALWLYATLEGIISARTIADYCKEHAAFKWICGKVSVCHHTLSNFMANYSEQLDEFLTQSIAILMQRGFIDFEDLKEVAQDGMRVRANAGSSSFKKEKTLNEFYQDAEKYLKKLKEEFTKNPGASRSRKQAADLRAVREREENVKEALIELNKLKNERTASYKKNGQKLPVEDLEKVRASTTDPEARIMKMADNGFRPAYNVQFATTTKRKIIVGVDVNNQGNDIGLLCDMMTQVKNRCGKVAERWLADGGYSTIEGIEEAAEMHKECAVYTPARKHAKSKKDPYAPNPKDSEIIAEWRARMGTEEAKEIYKKRSSSAEFSNAQARNKGCTQFLVRGLKMALGVACLFAIAHNMQRFFTLQQL